MPHFEAVDGDVSLTLGLRFNPFAIGHDDVVLVAGHLRALPRAIAAEPRAKVADLPVPTRTEPDEESPSDRSVLPGPGDRTSVPEPA